MTQALNNADSLWYFMPETALVVTFAAILIAALPKDADRKNGPILASLGVLVYLGLAIYVRQSFPPALLFHGMILNDAFTDFFRIFTGLTALIAIYLSAKSKELAHVGAEYWMLLIGIVLGMPLLASSNNLLMIYFSMELISILSYILVGFIPGSRHSSEAAIKYVLYGATASGVMIYGLSILFGITGTLDALQIQSFLLNNPVGSAGSLAIFVALLMTFVGFGYKVSVVPFHMWAPDVYQGAPTPVTAFLSVGPKAAGFAILFRFVYTALSQKMGSDYEPLKYVDISGLMALLAAATMTLGNFVAIQQTNVKRFLAYSSIAHAGYMIMAAAALSDRALQGFLFYLIAYLIMNFGAFAVVIAVINFTGSDSMDAFKGLAKRSRQGAIAAVAMLIFLISLTGLPPTVGFVGKFYLFSAVIEAKIYWLAVVGVLNSVVSLYYYAKIIKLMFFEDAADSNGFSMAGSSYSGLLILLSAAVIALGVFWSPLADFVRDSAVLLLK